MRICYNIVDVAELDQPNYQPPFGYDRIVEDFVHQTVAFTQRPGANQNGVDIKRVATPSASKKTSKSPEEKRRKRGAIIGGIIGGVVGLATLLGILL